MVEENGSSSAPRPAAPHRRWGRKVLLAGLVVAVGAVLWINSAPATSHDEFFSVPSGASASRVTALLAESGQIRSRRWFLWLVGFRKAAGRLRAGVYEIERGQSAWGILENFLRGNTRRIRVTVPEGFASWQIAERLEANDICGAEDFKAMASSAAAEGTLFPETYHLEQGMPPAEVLRLMREQFQKNWDEALSAAVSSGSVRQVVKSTSSSEERIQLADGRWWTRRQAVTMASLIEREARLPAERPLVSAVYHNRLKKRIPLEADPTVQFALGYWKERVLFRDLEVDSPYNTYRHYGLPPGPICSPGRAALAAALSPASVDYLYFVADQQGGHRFSVKFDEHKKEVRNRNRERRLKKTGKR
ncbi:MAG TPA: endolytic transglycosylase MltG [Elusimicrobiota bacterium]|nr:endolytic transglycosylase MltG [Elusimicrobiota bacterium]